MKFPSVKFLGKFRDLIPNGWTFQKLFSNNYRQYHKTHDGTPYSQGLRIWQHHGGYVELADLYDLTYLVFQAIMDGRLVPEDNRAIGTIIDVKKNLIHIRGEQEFHNIRKKFYLLRDEKDFDDYYKCYREFNIARGTLSLIQDMIDKNWVKICKLC